MDTMSYSKLNKRQLISLLEKSDKTNVDFPAMLEDQTQISRALILMLQQHEMVYEKEILSILLKQCSAHRAGLFRYSSKNGGVDVLYEKYINETLPHVYREMEKYTASALPWYTAMLVDKGDAVFINTPDDLPAEAASEKQLMIMLGITSMAIVPIIISGTTWGFIVIDREGSGAAWDERDRYWLKEFAQILGVGLQYKEMTDNMLEQERMINSVLSYGSLGFWHVDTKPFTAYFSGVCRSMLGYEGCDRGDHTDAIKGITHPEDRERLRLFMENIKKGMAENLSVEVRMKTRKGHWKWLLLKVVGSRYNRFSESKSIVGIGIDIDGSKTIKEQSEQIQLSEKKYKNLFRNMTIGYVYGQPVYGEDNTLSDCVLMAMNPAFEKITGLKIKECIGKHSLNTAFPIEKELLEMCGDVVRNGTQKQFDYYYKPLDLWFSMVIYPSVVKNGFVILFNDVSKRKEAENELIKARQKAEESDRLKSSFLANVSHEIRTPLNSIVGFSEIIAETGDEQERKHYYDIVKTNSGLLLHLINDILDLSKIEAGRMELNNQPADLHTMLCELQQTHQLLAQEGVKVVMEEPQERSCMLTDYNRLHQVCVNLLGNAVKNTETGSITIGYRRDEGDIIFYVRDTGKGIPQDKLDSIFNRFVKVNENTCGFGLGLAISKSIVEKMGGRMEVESWPEKGSEFRFVVPYVGAECECTGQRAAVGSGGSDKNGFLNGEENKKTILIADDNNGNIDLLKAMLEPGCNLCIASDGMEAVEKFVEHDPDIILMDIKMPNVDGLEAARAIREVSPDIPIIALSAVVFETDRQAALNAGCNDFIAKPFEKRALIDTLGKYI